MAANGTNGVKANGNDVEAQKPVEREKEAGGDTAVKIGDKAVDFAKISIPEAFGILKAVEGGLDDAEVKRRLEQYGYNKLPESTRIPFLVFLGYLWNPLSWAMEVAALLAIILLDYADFALIVALLLVNATISFVEESNADKAIKALTAALAPKARVKRDGKVKTIEATELVPGDIIIIQFGNIVPADVKLLGHEGADEAPMQIDQAALTGESLPAKKYTGHVAFSGSTVKQGEKEALVYATGENTFFGRAAALISGTHNVANLQKIMTRIGGTCLVTIGVWCIIELAVQFGHYKHVCHLGEEGCPTLTNMLVIIVGGIPIAMPTVLSVTLALGAYKLAKEGAIVARMSAVEEMAGMDILCSDKTGTLTLNQLTVDKDTCMVQPPHSLEDALKWGALSANIVSEEPIDVVLHEAYDGHDTLWNDYTLQRFVPFNPTDKYTIAHVKNNKTGECTRIMKGAPQVVLKKAHNYAEIGTPVHDKITEFAGRGFRALGVAITPDDGTPIKEARWEFLVLLPLFDPPRHDTKETIEKCIAKGIQVKMVTGDQLLIGKETAKQLGMGTNMYTTELLLGMKEGKIPKSELPPEMAHVNDVDELVEHADGFAEVFPEHKFEVVSILKGRRHIVGMTGDGVNDAPALKKADVGIAVSGATDAARGAADIVLTRPGLSVIVSAIIGARKIFQRMTTYSKYTVAMTFRVCFTFGLLTVIYDWYFPTILIVALAVFNDGAMIALSKDRVISSPVPNHWNLRNIFLSGIVYGLYLTLSSWVLYYVATHMTFFADQCHLNDLNTTPGNLMTYCTGLLQEVNVAPDAPIGTVPGYASQTGKEADLTAITAMQQCMAEQKYVRDSTTRSLIYSQVSISGQALVFVVRTSGWSPMMRAGALTYIAFFAAQIGSSMIAGFGFGGYTHPRTEWAFLNGQFTRMSTGSHPPFLTGGEVPIATTEGIFTGSVIGCTYYVIVAWIWSIIWYLGLDPIKWALMYMLNEDGWRNKGAFQQAKKDAIVERAPEPESVPGFERVSYSNPLGRRSMATAQQRPNFLERASVVMVDSSGLTRAPADKIEQKSLTLKDEHMPK